MEKFYENAAARPSGIRRGLPLHGTDVQDRDDRGAGSAAAMDLDAAGPATSIYGTIVFAF